MGLEKAIKHKKEKRKPYKGSKRWDNHCRNHGTCSWCQSNRTISTQRAVAAAEDRERTDRDG